MCTEPGSLRPARTRANRRVRSRSMVWGMGPRVHVLLGLLLVSAPRAQEGEPPPNIVLVLTDDQGYGDLGCYGAEGLLTPHLDRMAAEGMRFTDFHVSQGVCSASRASLLTGCYAERVGIRGALGPNARVGLNPEEETIAELLRARGYATGIFGKWHLGHHEPFLPLQHGFDEFFGLPYSNDMWPVGFDGAPLADRANKASYPPLRLIEGNQPGEVVSTLADQARLTELYTVRALRFIAASKDRPFFLYLPHSMPHVPLGRPEAFRGKARTPYGDVIAEIDASMGRILAALDEHGLRERTLVIFTSDNGPWLNFGNHAGSTGGLREGKGTGWEGGARVPCLMRWPGRIPAGSVCTRLAATIDLLPTIAALTGARLPAKPIDGVDLTPLLEGRAEAAPRREYAYYYEERLVAVRRDDWKLALPHEYRSYLGVEPGHDGFPGPYATGKCELELHDLAHDPGETTSVAAQHAEIVRELEALAERTRRELGDRLLGVHGSGVRPPGRLPASRASPIRHRALARTVTLVPEPDPKYPGRGAASLVDGVLGSEDCGDGTWLGFQGVDLEAVVDLGAELEIERIACSFLLDQRSWIFLPRAVELALSTDGVHFESAGRFEHALEADPATEARQDELRLPHRKARYLRLRATNAGACPAWHPGAGGASWIFVDELVVE